MRELPIEIWHQIMSLLSAEDLEACSKVCKQWHSVTEADILWKPLCLEKRWNKIHHHFIITDPDVSHENGSQWRKIYDNNQKLYNKWKSKMWTRHSLASRGHQGEVFSVSSDSRSLAVGYQNGTVLVWNISTKPLMVTTIKCLLPNYPVLEVKVSTCRVVAVQDRLVQVFDITSSEPNLSRVICLDLGPSYSDLTSSWTSLPYFHSWYRECLRVNEVKTSKRLLTALGGSHLVLSTGEEGSVYTWSLDINGQSKSFTIEGKVKQLLTWEETVYIVGWDRRSTKISEYSGMEACLDQIVDSPSICKAVLSEKFILTVPAEGGFTLQKLRVYSRKSGDFIGCHTITSAMTHACVTCADIVIFSEENTIYVWDPQENVITHKVSFLTPSYGLLPVNFLDARFSDFLVVLLDNAVCVYDWVKGIQLYSITSQLEWSEDYINLIWTCPTAMVVGGIYNKPELLSFV